MATILIAEDHAPSSELLRYLFEASGHRVLVAEDGVRALEVARDERPDVIVCDLHMPGVDGYAVVRRMREDRALRPVPVVAVTAVSMAGDRDRVLSAGFDGYIAKPIDPETFVRRVEAFIAPAAHAAPEQG